jgi:predicted nuclease of restriction endonuclease-like RecB superfamily
MLTGPLVRVRYARDRILPYFIDPANEEWREVAEQLRELFLAHQGRTRGEVEAAIDEMFGDDNDTLVQRGLAKLLEDRCGFETAPGLPPEQLRQEVFKAAVEYRLAPTEGVPAAFDRDEVLRRVGLKHSLTPEQILLGLYADLKSEQRLIEFEDISAEHLLQRYNVALAQSILLRAVRVHVTITGEPPPRWRAILRRLKFHRLLCEVERVAADSYTLHLDGPLSLFSATQKYGLQLALFLPAVLPCRDFAMKAELKWGTQKKDKTFLLSNKDRLTWPGADPGQYVPPELTMFVESFRKRITDWELREETDVHQLGNAFWVPDFRLTHRPSGRSVLLEVMGFWRRSSAEKHLAFLRRYAREPFVLAVSDQLHIDEGELESLPAGVARFKHLPLADEVARLADAALRGTV